MKTRGPILLAWAFLAFGCGQMGDSMTGLFGQEETPPPAATPAVETDAVADGDAEEAALPAGENAAEEEPPRVRLRDLDPANTEALDSERVICEEKGGRWARAGSSAAHACVMNTRDANKVCTRANQCEGYCLARSGTCAPVTPLFGCHEVISSSGAKQTLCVN